MGERRRGRVRLALAAFASALVTAGLVVPATGAAAAPSQPPRDCDPLHTEPRHRGQVPTAQQVLGFELGDRQASVEEVDRYLGAVDRASPRVTTRTLGRSWEGRPMRYALVSTPGNLSHRKLARIGADARKLRDPGTAAREVDRIKRRMPAILWVAGNVHGDEPSGADAILRLAHHLADRTDCVARTVLDNALVVLFPMQNPDGRAADTRENTYTFDLNRDWFTGTQVETREKVAELWKFPPMLFIDEHEMGGTGYFFPPNSDPVYHEISQTPFGWINDIYGANNIRAFTERGIPFETYEAGYDLFYQGYGDTAPITAFGAAGMTFEKGGRADYSDKVDHHYLSAVVSVFSGARARSRILDGYHDQYVEAQRQGEECALEPNAVYNPGNEVQFPVPDLDVCGYFLRADDPTGQVERVIQRLQRMHVEVRVLTRPVRVPDFRRYGRDPAPTTLRAGTYWIPMDQPQKHWVQAMLHENTYVPFTFFYDVSAWSLPLLAGVSGGYTGTKLDPPSAPAPPVRQAAGASARGAGQVAVLTTADRDEQTLGWLRWRLDRDWRLDYDLVDAAKVGAGGLAGYDVLLVPDLDAEDLAEELGQAGREALVDWVNGGGRYVGWADGTELAARIGVSTVELRDATSRAPGTLFRVRLDEDSPLARGLGQTTMLLYRANPLMRTTNPDASVVAAFPPADSADWFMSGYAEGAEELGGTAAVVDEPVGAGRAIVFSFEPNFRAYTDGTAALLRNAVLARDVRALAAPQAGSPARAELERAARSAAASLAPVRDTVRISVPRGDAGALESVLRGYRLDWTVLPTEGGVTYVVPTGGQDDERLAWTRQLPRDLKAAGVRPLTVIVP